jgi:protein transport protein SEC24
LQLALPELDTPESKSLRALIDRLRGQRPRFLRVFVVRQRDGSEAKWNLQMMEDAGLDTMSYVDFLCYMHRQIQSSL